MIVGTERLCLLVQEDLVKMRRASSEILATQRMLETRVANVKRDGVSSYGCVQSPGLGLVCCGQLSRSAVGAGLGSGCSVVAAANDLCSWLVQQRASCRLCCRTAG